MSDHIEEARRLIEAKSAASDSLRAINADGELRDWAALGGVSQLLATIDAQAAEIAELRQTLEDACRTGLSAIRDEAERSKRIEAQRDTQAAEIASLEDLVSHCWVHRDYCDCGYEQMTTEQRQLHDAAITHSNKRAGIE